MKLKTSLVTVCLTLIAGVVSIHGQTAESAPAPAEAPASTWTVTPSFVSQYMFRGVRLGGPSFQPTIEYGSGSLAVGLWSNFPLRDKVVGVSDPEFDLYSSYTIAINDALSVVPGFTWYFYPRADKNIGFYTSSFEPSLAVNYTVSGIKLTPKLYYDTVLKGPTYELTAAVAVPLKDAGTELNFAATIGTYKWTDAAENNSPAVKNWGDYWQLGVSMPFAVSTTSKVVVGYAYTEGRDNFYKQGTAPQVQNTAAVGRGVVTLSYSITF